MRLLLLSGQSLVLAQVVAALEVVFGRTGVDSRHQDGGCTVWGLGDLWWSLRSLVVKRRIGNGFKGDLNDVIWDLLL